MSLDFRILRIGIQVGETDEYTYYEDLNIVVTGSKFGSANVGQCSVEITNLNKDTANAIVTNASPYLKAKARTKIRVEAGRVSTGYSLVYQGLIFRAWNTQPPDIVTTMTCINENADQNATSSLSIGPGQALLATAQAVANANGLTLAFNIDDRIIKGGFSFSGSGSQMIAAFSDLYDGMRVFQDYKVLYIEPLDGVKSSAVKILNPNNIVGRPQVTDTGMLCTFLFSEGVRLSTKLDMQSEIFTELNTDYYIAQLTYHLTNRDLPWYYTANAIRFGLN